MIVVEVVGGIPEPTVGRCGSPAPQVFVDGGITSFCRLPAGHEGWHRGDDGSEWSRDEAPWQDAALSAWHAWDRFASARNPVEAADAITAMSNAMSDLATFLPGYDYRTGTIADPDGEVSS